MVVASFAAGGIGRRKIRAAVDLAEALVNLFFGRHVVVCQSVQFDLRLDAQLPDCQLDGAGGPPLNRSTSRPSEKVSCGCSPFPYSYQNTTGDNPSVG